MALLRVARRRRQALLRRRHHQMMPPDDVLPADRITTPSLRTKFVNIENSVETRTLFVSTARTSNYGLKLLKVMGPRIWNSLPSLLRINESLNSFIEKLKIILINNYK